MKKSFLKNLMIVSFAFAALFLIGNNVFADPPDENDNDYPGEGGGSGFVCYNSGVFQEWGSYRSCTTCLPVYHGKGNYWDVDRCLP